MQAMGRWWHYLPLPVNPLIVRMPKHYPSEVLARGLLACGRTITPIITVHIFLTWMEIKFVFVATITISIKHTFQNFAYA